MKAPTKVVAAQMIAGPLDGSWLALLSDQTEWTYDALLCDKPLTVIRHTYQRTHLWDDHTPTAKFRHVGARAIRVEPANVPRGP